jgi:hypothetical protein
MRESASGLSGGFLIIVNMIAALGTVLMALMLLLSIAD